MFMWCGISSYSISTPVTLDHEFEYLLHSFGNEFVLPVNSKSLSGAALLPGSFLVDISNCGTAYNAPILSSVGWSWRRIQRYYFTIVWCRIFRRPSRGIRASPEHAVAEWQVIDVVYIAHKFHLVDPVIAMCLSSVSIKVSVWPRSLVRCCFHLVVT